MQTCQVHLRLLRAVTGTPVGRHKHSLHIIPHPSSLSIPFMQIVLLSQTIIIAASFAILFSGLDPSKPGGIQDEVRWGVWLAGIGWSSGLGARVQPLYSVT